MVFHVDLEQRAVIVNLGVNLLRTNKLRNILWKSPQNLT